MSHDFCKTFIKLTWGGLVNKMFQNGLGHVCEALFMALSGAESMMTITNKNKTCKEFIVCVMCVLWS